MLDNAPVRPIRCIIENNIPMSVRMALHSLYGIA